LYVRSIKVKGHTYYQAEECYRDNGKPKIRFLVSLGTSPTLQEAFHKCEDRYFAGRKGRKAAPFDDGDRKRWCRLAKIERLLRKDKDSGYVRSETFRAENLKWARWEKKAAEEKSIEAYQDFLARLEVERQGWLSVLGLPADPTPAQIKAAYHRKARDCHPDHGGSDSAMATINEAYESLLD
jgi:DnaJ domain